MSRAREASFAYVVADEAAQAREDLAREWSSIRRPHWALGAGAVDLSERKIEVVPDEAQAAASPCARPTCRPSCRPSPLPPPQAP